MQLCQEEQDHLSELSMPGAKIFMARLKLKEKLNKIISRVPIKPTMSTIF